MRVLLVFPYGLVMLTITILIIISIINIVVKKKKKFDIKINKTIEKTTTTESITEKNDKLSTSPTPFKVL